MNKIYENLLWLLESPKNFSEILANADDGNSLRELAKYSLDEIQLSFLSRRIQILRNQKNILLPLVPLRIGIISNATTSLIVPALIGTAIRFGINLEVIESGFNQVAQEALALDSAFKGEKIDVILVAIDYRGLPITQSPGNFEQGQKNIEECLVYIKQVIEGVRKNTGAKIIFQNIPTPVAALSGSYEARLPGSVGWIIANLNLQLGALASDDTFMLDVEGLASILGLSSWHDLTMWNIAKLPFSQRYIPIYADYICRILSARLGKSRRCLVLDLDNTLWGGVIGDDGLEGILIGNGNPTGEAYLELQRTVLNLRARGVVLAVSSKNEESNALMPFEKHPEMILRSEHIAIFQANWKDKASNIRAIAEHLSLGIESLVFLDDNPAERMQVRRELPDLAVPELPDDPALFAGTLIAAGYFEAIAFSDEDQKRADFYQDNAKRLQVLNQSSDMEAYLKTLQMEITFSKFNRVGRARIAQLISKSNQFNLTTKRYDEADIAMFEGDSNLFTRQIRLKDVFGDNGMISVIICRKDSRIWEIDTWLMSCRVLGRKVEAAALQDIIRNAANAGAKKIIGKYEPTNRNEIVRGHYEKLGFTKISNIGGVEKWELEIASYSSQVLPFKLLYAE